MFENVRLGVIPRSVDLPRCAFGLSDEKKLSIAAVSQTLPDRLIDQVMP